jgi:hypothetical protein
MMEVIAVGERGLDRAADEHAGFATPGSATEGVDPIATAFVLEPPVRTDYRPA